MSLGKKPEHEQTEVHELFKRLYDELHGIAGALLNQESRRRSHTLSPTALLHEGFLRVSSWDMEWEGENHFRSTAARVLRRVLVDHARTKKALKRGGSMGERVSISDVQTDPHLDQLDVLDLEDALQELEGLSQRHAEIVTLRFFGGLSIPEAADDLSVSVSTANADWRFARSWLARRLS